MLKKCKARLVVRVFDCCHSGERFSNLEDYLNNKANAEIDPVSSRALEPAAALNENAMPEGPGFSTRSLESDMFKAMMKNERGWVTFTGCNMDETAGEVNRSRSRWHPDHRGIFTYCFIEGLKGKAKRDDGPFYIEDLKLYVYEAVLEEINYWNDLYRTSYMAQGLHRIYGPYDPLVQHPQYQCSVSGNITID